MRSTHAKLAYIAIHFIGERWLKGRIKGRAIALILLGIGCGLAAKSLPVFSAPAIQSEMLMASEVSGSATTDTQAETNTTKPQQIDITGGKTAGTNLFHQFGQFDLSENATARFLTDSGIQNIIGHIVSAGCLSLTAN